MYVFIAKMFSTSHFRDVMQRGNTVFEVESDGSGALYIRSKLRSTVAQDVPQSKGGSVDSERVLDEEVYRAGCMVNVHTSNSDDDLSGSIVVVGDDDLIVRLHSGPRLRVPYSQLRDKRYVNSTFLVLC